MKTGGERSVTFIDDLLPQRLKTEAVHGHKAAVAAALRQNLPQQQPDFADALGQTWSFHRRIFLFRL